jgi:hypothetical protein
MTCDPTTRPPARLSLGIVLSLALVSWSDGQAQDDPPQGGSPVHVWLFAHHYVGEGGIYASAAQIEAVSQAIDGLGVPATFYFDGISVQELLSEDPGLLDQLARNRFLSFGYHGEDTHGPYPVPTMLSAGARTAEQRDITYGESWDDAVGNVTAFASYARSYTLVYDASVGARVIDRMSGGVLDPTQEGGVLSVAHALARYGLQLSIASYHGTESAPAQAAFQGVVPVPVVQGGQPLVSHAGSSRGVADEERYSLGGDGDVFLFMGALNTKARPDAELATTGGVADIRSLMASIDRSRPRLVSLGLMASPTPDGGLDTSALQEQLEWLRDVFFPANPGSGFVTPGQLAELIPVASAPDAAAISEIAAAVISGTTSVGPPASLATSSGSWSLAEGFEALAGALMHYDAAGTLPARVALAGVLGPIGEAADLPRGGGRRVSIAAIARAAATAFAAIRSGGTSTRPASVPYATVLDGAESNTAELLLAMARAYRAIEAGRSASATIAVATVGIVPPYGRVLEALFPVPATSNPLWCTKLQLWTVKPIDLAW